MHADSVIPEIYGFIYRLQKIVYRAKMELELLLVRQKLSHPILIRDGDEYFELSKERKKRECILLDLETGHFCPEPPGGIKKQEYNRPDGKCYYSVCSLWDLQYILDLEGADEDAYLKRRNVYDLDEPDLFWNRSYHDYNDLMVEEVYFIEDINQLVMVETAYVNC